MRQPPPPPLTREKFIVEQERRIETFFSRCTTDESDARARFMQLACDTFDFLVAEAVAPWQAFHVEQFEGVSFQGRMAKEYPGLEAPSALQTRWADWDLELDDIFARNPRFGLDLVMNWIGESNGQGSWPYRQECRIYKWIKANDPSLPPPFVDGYGIVPPKFYRRLHDLWKRSGGWFSDYNDSFVSDAEMERICADQEARELANKKQYEKSLRIFQRLEDIVAIARADTQFWQALKSWELDRQSQPPEASKGQHFGPHEKLKLPRGFRVLGRRQMTAEDEAALERLVDPFFLPFILRVREPEDELNNFLIMTSLRNAVRSELGLSGSYPV